MEPGMSCRHNYSSNISNTGYQVCRDEMCASQEGQMQKPDFSGEWILTVGESALSPVVAPVVQSGFVHIEHDEPMIAVHLFALPNGLQPDF